LALIKLLESRDQLLEDEPRLLFRKSFAGVLEVLQICGVDELKKQVKVVGRTLHVVKLDDVLVVGCLELLKDVDLVL